jgi:hypothetical protein
MEATRSVTGRPANPAASFAPRPPRILDPSGFQLTLWYTKFNLFLKIKAKESGLKTSPSEAPQL